jgi:hypothetical protein
MSTRAAERRATWRDHLAEIERTRRVPADPDPWTCPRCGGVHLAQNPPTCEPPTDPAHGFAAFPDFRCGTGNRQVVADSSEDGTRTGRPGAACASE